MTIHFPCFENHCYHVFEIYVIEKKRFPLYFLFVLILVRLKAVAILPVSMYMKYTVFFLIVFCSNNVISLLKVSKGKKLTSSLKNQKKFKDFVHLINFFLLFMDVYEYKHNITRL